MLIDLKTIPETGRSFDFRMKPQEWRSAEGEDIVVEPAGPIDVKADIQRAGNSFIVNGVIKASLWLSCDRCLNSFQTDVDTSFHTYLALYSDDVTEEDLELDEDDMDVDFVSEGVIDLFALIRGQVLLNLPMKNLCSDDCKGLCGRCGKDLNQGPCECRSSGGHPAFKTLEDLKPGGGQ